MLKRNSPLEIFTVLVFVMFVGLILYYAFWPFKITTLNTISVDSAEYCRGEWVKVRIDFKKHMDVVAEVKWYLVDGVIYELDSPGISRSVGDNNFEISKQLPMSVLPGKHHLRVKMTYNVHPLHEPIINFWNTPTFTILGNDACPTADGEAHINVN